MTTFILYLLLFNTESLYICLPITDSGHSYDQGLANAFLTPPPIRAMGSLHQCTPTTPMSALTSAGMLLSRLNLI